MEYLPGFLTAYSILLVAVMSPGPAVAMLLGISMSRGRASAVVAAIGVAAGSITMGTLAVIGLGVLVAQAAWTLTVMRILGSAYLLWMAYGAFRKAAQPGAIRPAEMPPLSRPRAFLTGYLMQITNPKAAVFWVAIASVGATHEAPVHLIALFLAGSFVMSLAGHMGYALALSSSPVRAVYLKARRGVEATLGVLFTFFAFKLATSRS
ncbi:threonine transporter [Oceanicola sp. 22II-s10i]|uniref:LysE family translocator n=1 Tax=Oceanicola sp. 22II-s10i TaxID=1317116 RepID=UPI000B525B8D|nr:LysE family translocator [Oceanicola sp. 22II-s10i]OWU83316.1 threonine transporter [Oceanicola sp. 22II-s10i]